jgi:hypothetical protein
MGQSEERDIYVVSSIDYGEDEGVVAVFGTRALAEHFAAASHKPGGSKYIVRTWRLNVTDWTPPEERA